MSILSHVAILYVCGGQFPGVVYASTEIADVLWVVAGSQRT